MHRAAVCVAMSVVALGFACATFAGQEKPASQPKENSEAREIFKQLIEIKGSSLVIQKRAALQELIKS